MAISLLLVVQGIVALFTGALYIYVARLVVVRDISSLARRANRAFALWWATFGGLQILVGLYQLPAAMGFRDLATVVTLLNIILIMYAVAVGALVYFLVFLYTGSERVFWPIVGAYLLLAIGLLYLVAWIQPTGFEEGSRGTLVYTRRLTGLPAVAFGLIFSLPVVVAALGYGSLYPRTHGRMQRFRIAVISVSFISWFGWSAVRSVLRLNERYPDSMALIAINTAITLAVPLMIVMAYRPFGWLRARIRVEAGVDG